MEGHGGKSAHVCVYTCRLPLRIHILGQCRAACVCLFLACRSPWRAWKDPQVSVHTCMCVHICVCARPCLDMYMQVHPHNIRMFMLQPIDQHHLSHCCMSLVCHFLACRSPCIASIEQPCESLPLACMHPYSCNLISISWVSTACCMCLSFLDRSSQSCRKDSE